MTRPAFTIGRVTVHHGDCLDVLRELPDSSVDAVVTDPPAGIAFMGRDWDGAKGGREQWSAWLAEVMRECHRIAKPGAHALVWALPRTSHWTACGLEDAGWEVRDRISHLFGSGFPKSLDIGKAIDRAAGAEREVIGRYMRPDGSASRDNVRAAKFSGTAYNGGKVGGDGNDGVLTAPATDAARRWDGWGTALKPAAEDWWLCRKPLQGTVAGNVLAWGTGGLNIDACRVTHNEPPGRPSVGPHGKSAGIMGETVERYRETTSASTAGRWPSNVTLTHHPDCGEVCDPGCPVAELDQQSGERPSGSRRAGTYAGLGYMGSESADFPEIEASTGGASRFFPTFRYQAKADTDERPRVNGTTHPTTKPLELMRWLVRLVTPPGGTVLDPFLGSGTTAEACVLEGFQCIGIEREPDYLPLIRARLTRRLDPVTYLTDQGEADNTLFGEAAS